MLDYRREKLVPLAQAATKYPNRHGTLGVNVGTVHRHAVHGVRGERLETVMCGGIRMTSYEAVYRFFARVTAAANGEAVSEQHGQSHADQQAAAFLASRGVSAKPSPALQ